MAQKFVKQSVDDTIVLSGSQIFRRPFNIGSDWTRMRFMAWLSFTAIAGNNNTPATETYGNSSAVDRWAFGIAKLASAGLIPGEAGINFAGHHNHAAEDVKLTINTSAASPVQFAGATANWNGGVTIGTTRNTSSTNVNAHPIQLPTGAQMSGTDPLWTMPWGMDIEILDRGGATQQIKIYTCQSDLSVQIGNRTEAQIQAALAAMSPQATAVGTYNFHIGGTPADIPDQIYIRHPFIANNLRIHGCGIKRLA